MKKVLISFWDIGERFHIDGLELLRKHNIEYEINQYGRILNEDNLIYFLKDKNGVIAYLEPYTSKVISSTDKLEIISRFGVGYENIDLTAAKKKGIKVTYTPIPELSQGLADATFGLLLSLVRNITNITSLIRLGCWDSTGLISGVSDLYNKTIGIIGMGRIGYQVAKRAKGFDMKVVYHDIKTNPQAEKELGAQSLNLKDLLCCSDVVTIHVNLNEKTLHMLKEKEFSMMKKGAFLINTSRGQVIDENALYRSLINGHLGGAALDVLEQEPPISKHPLLQLKNVLVTPHLGPGKETYRHLTMAAVENLIDVLEGHTPKFILT